MPRKCGACQLCCVLPAIPELGKPANVACVHLTPAGCGIYETRPETCRAFVCDWLGWNLGDESARPDRIGAYTTPLVPSDGLGSGPTNGMMIHADSERPRRFERSAAVRRAVGRVLDSGGQVLIAAGESRRLLTRNEAHAGLAVKDQDGRPVQIQRSL